MDLYNYNLTMKIKWLKNLVSEGNKDCYEFTNNIFDINKLFDSGIKYCETLCKAIKNDFWRDVLGSFKIYVSKCNFTTWSEVINMPLFYNENLRIGSKHFFNSTLYNHGIRYIRDVLTLSQTSPGFHVSAEQVFWKHCGKRRNCSLRAIPPFPTVFSTIWMDLPPFSSNLKLSSANCFILEESKICRLGKG